MQKHSNCRSLAYGTHSGWSHGAGLYCQSCWTIVWFRMIFGGTSQHSNFCIWLSLSTTDSEQSQWTLEFRCETIKCLQNGSSDHIVSMGRTFRSLLIICTCWRIVQWFCWDQIFISANIWSGTSKGPQSFGEKNGGNFTKS